MSDVKRPKSKWQQQEEETKTGAKREHYYIIIIIIIMIIIITLYILPSIRSSSWIWCCSGGCGDERINSVQ